MYLQVQKLSSSTINEHCSNIKRFVNWMKQENYLDAASIKYNDLLAHI